MSDPPSSRCVAKEGGKVGARAGRGRAARAECLVLGGRAHLPLDREPAQEVSDLGGAELSGMPPAVKHDVAPDPGDVRLLRAPAQVPGTELLARDVEKPKTGPVGKRGLTDGRQRCCAACLIAGPLNRWLARHARKLPCAPRRLQATARRAAITRSVNRGTARAAGASPSSVTPS